MKPEIYRRIIDNINAGLARDPYKHVVKVEERLESLYRTKARENRTHTEKLIHGMTNWQRNQWAKGGARKGYKKDHDIVKHFAYLTKETR